MKSRTSYRPYAFVALATASLLMVPLLAMQVSPEVVWTFADFALAAIMLGGTGLLYVLAGRIESGRYRAGAALALIASLGIVWSNMAVGIVGEPEHPANLMYFAAIVAGAVIAFGSRFRARGMARATSVSAGVVVVAGIISLASGWLSPAMEIVPQIILTGLYAASASLFGWAAEENGAGE